MFGSMFSFLGVCMSLLNDNPTSIFIYMNVNHTVLATCCFDKIPEQSDLKREVLFALSQLEGIVPHGWRVMVIEIWGSCSCHVFS